MIRNFSIQTLLMERLGRSVLAALLATAAAVPGDAAAASGRAWLATYNGYANRTMWVTIYDLGKTRQLDYGCVGANAWRSWESGNYAFGSFYYIRAELKEGPDCGGRTLCDTTVQVNPQYAGYFLPEFLGKPDPNPVTLLPNGNNCYWLKGRPAAPSAPAVTPPPVVQQSGPLSAPPALANISISGGVAPAARRLLSVPTEGNRADLYNTDDGTGHQRWRLQLSPDRVTYNIVVFGGVSGGRRYLSTTDDGTRVDLYTSDDGSGRQRWRIQPSADGRSYNLMIAGGVRGGRTYLSTVRDGSMVDLYTADDGSGRQRWTFTPR